MRWFAYNGDADGICSMVQWGLAYGLEGKRVTGVKRDIQLLDKISLERDDELVAMDISLERNHGKAKQFAESNHKIIWFDHHLSGEEIKGIESYIDTSAEMCTSKIVENYIGVKSAWAHVALHGDGLGQYSDRPDLAELGELLNYNGYGESLDDLHYHPDKLLQYCIDSVTPEEFIKTKVFEKLKLGFANDMANVGDIKQKDGMYVLPDLSWARRIVGVFAHRLNESPGPHVIAIDKGDKFQISVRGSSGIGELCKMFGGGGRETAGGIDALPKGEVPALMKEIVARRDN
ncbi:MAG: DHH family phosphoesterase [Candidatus Poseidoniaceae archaeon]|jgi:hypothetical protein|nr:DHH family phosphoesterase [Candidatus Poseidoniaceae archaeon]